MVLHIYVNIYETSEKPELCSPWTWEGLNIKSCIRRLVRAEVAVVYLMSWGRT